MSESFAYVGTELELFAAARNWKAYLARRIRPHLRGDVLEVGAGIGATTHALCDGRQKSWTCLEPDPLLAGRLRAGASGPIPLRVEVSTIDGLPAGERFDAILYIDVLEHIADDAAEVARAVGRLRPGGRLIVLAPALQTLFSEFDRAIGHFRRYSRGTLKAIIPAEMRRERLDYLDSTGVLLSLGNRLVNRQSMPTPSQIALWDRWVVPLSRVIDPLLSHRVGKSILGVWSR